LLIVVFIRVHSLVAHLGEIWGALLFYRYR